MAGAAGALDVGHDEDQAARQDAAFVRKPFNLAELIERVTQLLRGL